MKKIIYTQSILLHQLIRKFMYKTDYISTIKFLKNSLYDCINVENYKCNLSINSIYKILNFIVREDEQHNLVSSCISITLLAYLLCDFSSIKTKIVLGVKIINGKLISHSWLRILKNNSIINFFTDYKDYKIIKEFSLEDV